MDRPMNRCIVSGSLEVKLVIAEGGGGRGERGGRREGGREEGGGRREEGREGGRREEKEGMEKNKKEEERKKGERVGTNLMLELF